MGRRIARSSSTTAELPPQDSLRRVPRRPKMDSPIALSTTMAKPRPPNVETTHALCNTPRRDQTVATSNDVPQHEHVSHHQQQPKQLWTSLSTIFGPTSRTAPGTVRWQRTRRDESSGKTTATRNIHDQEEPNERDLPVHIRQGRQRSRTSPP